MQVSVAPQKEERGGPHIKEVHEQIPRSITGD